MSNTPREDAMNSIREMYRVDFQKDIVKELRGENRNLRQRIWYLEGQLKIRTEMYNRLYFGKNWEEEIKKCDSAHKEQLAMDAQDCGPVDECIT